MIKVVKKIDEIWHNPWGLDIYLSSPERKDIEMALSANDLDSRPFNIDGVFNEELGREWKKNAKNIQEVAENFKKYNAKRIAFLVKFPSDKLIVLKNAGGEIDDGSHRYEAAIYRKITELEVEIKV